MNSPAAFRRDPPSTQQGRANNQVTAASASFTLGMSEAAWHSATRESPVFCREVALCPRGACTGSWSLRALGPGCQGQALRHSPAVAGADAALGGVGRWGWNLEVGSGLGAQGSWATHNLREVTRSPWQPAVLGVPRWVLSGGVTASPLHGAAVRGGGRVSSPCPR